MAHFLQALWDVGAVGMNNAGVRQRFRQRVENVARLLNEELRAWVVDVAHRHLAEELVELFEVRLGFLEDGLLLGLEAVEGWRCLIRLHGLG